MQFWLNTVLIVVAGLVIPFVGIFGYGWNVFVIIWYFLIQLFFAGLLMIGKFLTHENLQFSRQSNGRGGTFLPDKYDYARTYGGIYAMVWIGCVLYVFEGLRATGQEFVGGFSQQLISIFATNGIDILISVLALFVMYLFRFIRWRSREATQSQKPRTILLEYIFHLFIFFFATILIAPEVTENSAEGLSVMFVLLIAGGFVAVDVLLLLFRRNKQAKNQD